MPSPPAPVAGRSRSQRRFLRGSLLAGMLAVCAATSAAVPEVRRVYIGSSPGDDLTYAAGDRISVTVQFDEKVEVAGVPVLDIVVGEAKRAASMWMHSGSRLHFGYTVDAADQDPDGISVDAGGLRLAGGRIVADELAADISLAGHAISHAGGHKVDGAGTRAPKLVGVSITSDPGADKTYAIGDEIEVTVEFDEGVTVEGAPYVIVRMDSGRRHAVYREGSGTSRVRFAYEIVAGDIAESGIALPTNGLRGGSLRDGHGNAPATDYSGVRKQPEHLVDGIAPKVVRVEVISTPPAGGVYGHNDAILVEVTFDDTVYVFEEWGRPAIWLVFGNRSHGARSIERRDRSVIFRHLVQADDTAERVRVGGNGALSWDWSAIRDVNGNAADRHVDGQKHDIVVDGSIEDTTRPGIRSVAIVSVPRDGNAYRHGERIAVRVVFTEAVRASASGEGEEADDRPEAWVTLTVGQEAKRLRTSMRNNRQFVDFEYVVEPSDLATTGIVVDGRFELGATVGGLMDTAGNEATASSLAFRRVDSTHLVKGSERDAHEPRLMGIDHFAWGRDRNMMRSGDRIGLRLLFDGVVAALGTPDIVVGKERHPSRRAGTWYAETGVTRSRVTFEVTVESDDFDPDGFSIPPDAWSGVSFRDQWGNPVLVDLTGTEVVNHGPPIVGKAADAPAAVAGVTIAPSTTENSVFAVGETVRLVIDFDNPVNLDEPTTLRLGDKSLPCSLDEGRLRLACEHTVVEGESAQGLALTATALRPSNAVTDDNGNAVDLDLAAFVGSIDDIALDGTPPTITRVGLASRPLSAHTYGAGARIEVVVRFDQPVVVAGVPELALTIGAETRSAPLVRSAGTGLWFQYTVSSADMDATGLSIPANAVHLNGGAITDAAGNPAVLAHAGLGDRRPHQVDGSVLDDSGTPVQIWITGEPSAAQGSPGTEATASLTWEMRSTWEDQPPAFYSVTSDHPNLRIGLAAGRATLNQGVTNSLAMPCPAGGVANARVTISVNGATVPVAWDVLCRHGRIRIRDVELFQGPLSARFGDRIVRRFADTVAKRPGVLRVRVQHEGLAAPEVVVRTEGSSAADIAAEYLGTATADDGRISSYLAAFGDGLVSRQNSLEAVADPHDYLDADMEAMRPQLLRNLSPVSLPVFRPVLVPISILGTEPDMSDPEGLLSHTTSLLPIAEMTLRVRTALEYSLTDEERRAQQHQTGPMFQEMKRIWNEEAAADEYYVGVFPILDGWTSDYGGETALLAQASVNVTGRPRTIAHELGHNFGLPHAPCGDPDQLDPDFPFSDGGVGPHTGWAAHEGRFVTPDDGYFDLMSYCRPAYISEYNYDKAMAWGDRIRKALEASAPVTTLASTAADAADPVALDMAPSAPSSLALSGSVDEHGTWSLYASAASTRLPRADPSGEFVVTLYDDSGIEQYSQSFATSTMTRSPMRTWAVRVPIQPRTVRAVRVRDSSGDLLLDANVTLPGRTSPQPLR